MTEQDSNIIKADNAKLGNVSKCCGDRLITNCSDDGTCYYSCFNCKKACDMAIDCATCFPQHFPVEEYKHCTVPICEKHAKEVYTECLHCWQRKTYPISDHSDCENCCHCGVLFTNANMKSEPEVTIKLPSSNNLEELLDEIQNDVNRGYTVRNLKAFLLDLNPEHIDYRIVAQFVAKRIKEMERRERMAKKKINA